MSETLNKRYVQSYCSIFYHEHILVKEPGTSKRTPWHHDQSYYPVDGEDIVSLWIPVDPVPIESAIKFVKGSHAWGKWFKPVKFASETNYPKSKGGGGQSQRYTY